MIEIQDCSDQCGPRIRIRIIADTEDEYDGLCAEQGETAFREAAARGWGVYDPDDGTGDYVIGPRDSEWVGGASALNDIEDSEMLTTAQAATLAECSKWTVYKAVDAGKLPATKHGRDWQYKQDDVEEWAKTLHRTPGRPKSGRFTQADAGRMLGVTPSWVSELMRRGVDLSTPERVVEWVLTRKIIHGCGEAMEYVASKEPLLIFYRADFDSGCFWFRTQRRAYDCDTLELLYKQMRLAAPLDRWRVK